MKGNREEIGRVTRRSMRRGEVKDGKIYMGDEIDCQVMDGDKIYK